MANDYVAIQVTVRNLNKQNEFLIHDIQVAVDTGVREQEFGRFKAGRDKLIVRGVAQRGQSEDRRNLILNTLTTVGNIAGGASAAVTQAEAGSSPAIKLATAVAIFQSAFIPGLINIFPDHTIEHINHINDLAFSASSTSKTVVPILGSVPLTTFITVRPLEQLPFSRCGQSIISVSALGEVTDRIDPRYKRQKQGKCSQKSDGTGDHTLSGDNKTTGGDNTIASNDRTAGKNNPSDQNRNKNDCKDDKKYDYSNNPGSAEYPACQLDGGDTLVPEFTRPLSFKKWRPAAVQILEHRVYVVVGGVHIQEVGNSPVVNNVNCPTLADGVSVDLSKADKNGVVTCPMTGSKLDRSASASLAQGTTTIPAAITAAADGNTASLTFKVSDVNSALKGAGGAFSLKIKDTSGNDVDTKQTIKFAGGPNITGVKYSSDNNGGLNAILTGSNLDRIASVQMVDTAKPPKVVVPLKSIPSGAATSADQALPVNFTSGELTNIQKATTVTMQYIAVNDSTKTPQDVPNSTYPPK